MSTLKADTVTSSTTNGNLSLTGDGTGGVTVTDHFILSKGSDIASATALSLGVDGNAFDVTGTTTITSIGTQGVGSHVTLHFDGILTFTHHATDLILPGAANITTAVGDVAVMYEYASADWRCVSYTKASGAAVVGGGFTLGTEQATTSGTSINFTSIPSTAKMIIVSFIGVSLNAEDDIKIQIGDSGGLETSGYVGGCMEMRLAVPETTEDRTDSFLIVRNNAAVQVCSAVATLTLEDSSDYTWMCHAQGYNASGSKYHGSFGTKSLSATLDRLSLVCGSGAFDAGVVNISYQ